MLMPPALTRPDSPGTPTCLSVAPRPDRARRYISMLVLYVGLMDTYGQSQLPVNVGAVLVARSLTSCENHGVAQVAEL